MDFMGMGQSETGRQRRICGLRGDFGACLGGFGFSGLGINSLGLNRCGNGQLLWRGVIGVLPAVMPGAARGHNIGMGQRHPHQPGGVGAV